MTPEQLEAILARFSQAHICVVGDLFLDKYLDIDPALAEVSLETGLEAHQVTRLRCYPGAAGTVANNLAALGVGEVAVLALVGDDGEGYDLRQALQRAHIEDGWLHVTPGFQTPTYSKPLQQLGGGKSRELNRLDIKNRRPLDAQAEQWLIDKLHDAALSFDAFVIADQVPERNHGVITDRVRKCLSELAQARPEVFFLADSRTRIGEFRNVIIKPNRAEATSALGNDAHDIAQAARSLAERTSRPVYITVGEDGLVVADNGDVRRVPTYRVSGEIDIVGAGDSTMAGIAAGLCSGATLTQAGLIGCLAASITIQQIGVTGTATQKQVRQRFADYVQQQQASGQPVQA